MKNCPKVYDYTGFPFNRVGRVKGKCKNGEVVMTIKLQGKKGIVLATLYGIFILYPLYDAPRKGERKESIWDSWFACEASSELQIVRKEGGRGGFDLYNSGGPRLLPAALQKGIEFFVQIKALVHFHWLLSRNWTIDERCSHQWTTSQRTRGFQTCWTFGCLRAWPFEQRRGRETKDESINSLLAW